MFRRCATNGELGGKAFEECLYMWVTMGDREAVEKFQPDEIADTDGDGYPEFVDAWGNPIKFLKWPTGFAAESEIMSGDYDNDHDPFDPRRIDPAAFRTVPLVWSSGPDKKSGLQFFKGSVYAWDQIYTKEYGRPVALGDPEYDDEYDTHHDNIHNHSLGMN